MSVTGTKTYSDSRRRDDAVRARARAHEPVELAAGQARSRHRSREAGPGSPAGTRQQEADQQDVCDMAQSQVERKVAALTALGYKVPTVSRPRRHRPASPACRAVKVLRPCDQFVSADGHEAHPVDRPLEDHQGAPAAPSVALAVVRGGKPLTVRVPVIVAEHAHHRRRAVAPFQRPGPHQSSTRATSAARRPVSPSRSRSSTRSRRASSPVASRSRSREPSIPTETSARSAACRRRRSRPAARTRRSSSSPPVPTTVAGRISRPHASASARMSRSRRCRRWPRR